MECDSWIEIDELVKLKINVSTPAKVVHTLYCALSMHDREPHGFSSHADGIESKARVWVQGPKAVMAYHHPELEQVRLVLNDRNNAEEKRPVVQ